MTLAFQKTCVRDKWPPFKEFLWKIMSCFLRRHFIKYPMCLWVKVKKTFNQQQYFIVLEQVFFILIHFTDTSVTIQCEVADPKLTIELQLKYSIGDINPGKNNIYCDIPWQWYVPLLVLYLDCLWLCLFLSTSLLPPKVIPKILSYIPTTTSLTSRTSSTVLEALWKNFNELDVFIMVTTLI